MFRWIQNVVVRSIECLSLLSEAKESIPVMMTLKVPSVISEILDRLASEREVYVKVEV